MLFAYFLQVGESENAAGRLAGHVETKLPDVASVACFTRRAGLPRGAPRSASGFLQLGNGPFFGRFGKLHGFLEDRALLPNRLWRIRSRVPLRHASRRSSRSMTRSSSRS